MCVVCVFVYENTCKEIETETAAGAGTGTNAYMYVYIACVSQMHDEIDLVL